MNPEPPDAPVANASRPAPGPWASTTTPLQPETVVAQALGWVDAHTRAITPPIHVSSTYLRDADNQYRSGRIYARADNPAFDQAEAVVNTLEGGHQTLLFASGMPATVYARPTTPPWVRRFCRRWPKGWALRSRPRCKPPGLRCTALSPAP